MKDLAYCDRCGAPVWLNGACSAAAQKKAVANCATIRPRLQGRKAAERTAPAVPERPQGGAKPTGATRGVA